MTPNTAARRRALLDALRVGNPPPHLRGWDDFEIDYDEARRRVAGMTPAQAADVVDSVVMWWSPLQKVALDYVLDYVRASTERPGIAPPGAPDWGDDPSY